MMIIDSVRNYDDEGQAMTEVIGTVDSLPFQYFLNGTFDEVTVLNEIDDIEVNSIAECHRPRHCPNCQAGHDGYTPIKGVDYFDGVDGAQGIPGQDGAQGPQGNDGYTPVKGVDYFDGLQGPQGLPGADSVVPGPQGEPGIQGIQGVKGDTGDQGVKGDTGDTGPAGTTDYNALTNKPDLSSKVDTTDPRLSDARTPLTHNHDTAYEAKNANIQAHVISAHAPSTAQKNSDITKAEIEAKLIGAITSHTHTGGGADPFTRLTLAGNVATGANVTPVNLTGMSFAFEANSTYLIDLYMIQQSAVATTGFGYLIDTSVAVTSIALLHINQLANTGTISGGGSIADAVGTSVSSGLPTANTNVPVLGSGILRTGANAGTAQFMMRAEVAAVTTTMAGSVIRIMKV